MTTPSTYRKHLIPKFLNDEERDWIERECARRNRSPMNARYGGGVKWTLNDLLNL